MEINLSQEWLNRSIGLAVVSIPVLVCVTAVYIGGRAFYNLFLHPLRSYPGPFLWRMSSLPYDYYFYNGVLTKKTLELHKKYGSVVRLTPGELSFTSSQAIKDILGHAAGKPEYSKRKNPLPPNGLENILNAGKENHSRFRRLLSHAFSEKGLRDQEGHIRHHIDLLIERLSERAKDGSTEDMVNWYNMVRKFLWYRSLSSLSAGFRQATLQLYGTT